MTYEEARAFIDDTARYGAVLGLTSVTELVRRLGNPQDDLKFVHIAGTNGKGSTLAYISTILKEAGYRVGRYISPTLFSYRERIQVNGERIGKEALAKHVTAIEEAIRDMEEHHLTNPTPFEIETALSFLYFQEKKCDLVVLETGLGGALDATNIIKTPVMEVITPISMDHMAFLGDTLEEIAAQKAGIIKPYTKVVSGPQEDGARKVLEEKAREQGASLEFLDMEEVKDIHYGYEKQSFTWRDFDQVEISLAGSYQILNAALALQAVTMLQELGYSVSRENIYEGFRKTHWRGRFTLISKEPVVIMDGAHNPGAARELEHSLKLYFPHRHIRYIFGIFQDKDYKQVIQITAPLADHIITVQTPDNPRALPAEELKEAVACVNPSVEAAKSIEQAVEKTLEEAKPEDVVIIFGSLSFLGEAERNVKKWKEKQDGLQ